MSKEKLLEKVLIYLSFLCCFSCANLDHINKYAHSATEGVMKLNDIPFSFGNYCNNYQEAALTNSIQYDIAPLPKLDCKFYSNSDTALKIFNNVLLAYLQGLEKLSAKDLIDYDVSNAAISLQTLQGKIGWNVGDTQVTATKNIVNTLLNNFMNGYRKKKLKQIIDGSQSDFKKVIEAYMMGIRALKGEAKKALDNYRDFYSNTLLDNRIDNPKSPIKVFIVRDYHHQEDVFAKTDQSIESYLKILSKIESGFIQLSNASNKLTADDLKSSLTQCIKDLKYLKAQMTDLKILN